MDQIEYTCHECEGKFDADDEACGFAGLCPLCGEWIELDYPRKVAEMRSKRKPARPSDQEIAREYFELFSRAGIGFTVQQFEKGDQNPSALSVANHAMSTASAELMRKYGLSQAEMIDIAAIAMRRGPFSLK